MTVNDKKYRTIQLLGKGKSGYSYLVTDGKTKYIDGETVFDLVLREQLQENQLDQIRSMCKLLYKEKKNIDYFPTNFVVHNNKLYYVDYEYNDYMDEWNFENWGQKYWSCTEEFLQYVNSHK